MSERGKPSRAKRERALPRLHTIKEGTNALLQAAKIDDPEQKVVFYRAIGDQLLNVLPDRVTDLRLNKDVTVSRHGDRPERQEWTLFSLEDYAKELAELTDEGYKRRFTKKKKDKK